MAERRSAAPGGDEPPLRAHARALVQEATAAASASDRDDITARLSEAAERVAERPLRVLVVGEFKQGKSTLVNALLGQALCPVDDDITTAAPITVRYGEDSTAVVRWSGADGETVTRPIAVDEIAAFATDAADASAHASIAVDVTLPHPLLRTGIELVDTPGIGGLGSAHGAITAAALPSADAVVLVSDASQPLTRPELDLLSAARSVCPTVVCVLSKIDLYPAWRKVADLDVVILRDAGMPVEVVPVSATLHTAVAPAAEPERESGIDRLADLLATDVVHAAAAVAAAATAASVSRVADHLLTTLRAEHAAQIDPTSSADVRGALDAALSRAAQLDAASASWQTTLDAEVEQLAADADHRLHASLRSLRRAAEEALDHEDPAKIWEQYEVWLTRQTGGAVADAYVFVATRARAAAAKVLQGFGEDEGAIVGSLDVAVPGDAPQGGPGGAPAVGRIEVGALERRGVQGESLVERGMSLLHGAHGGVEVFSVLAGVVGFAVANPLVIGLGLLLGGTALRQQRIARITARREAALEITTRYLDDVAFAARKDVADTIRAVEQSLRQQLAARARELHQTVSEAAAAAQQAVHATAAERAERAGALADLIALWEAVQEKALRLDDEVTATAGSPA